MSRIGRKIEKIIVIYIFFQLFIVTPYVMYQRGTYNISHGIYGDVPNIYVDSLNACFIIDAIIIAGLFLAVIIKIIQKLREHK